MKKEVTPGSPLKLLCICSSFVLICSCKTPGLKKFRGLVGSLISRFTRLPVCELLSLEL